MGKRFYVTQSQIAKCPKQSLDAKHYNPDGTCKCSNEKKDGKVKQ